MNDFNIDTSSIEENLRTLEEQMKTAMILAIISPSPPFSKGGVGGL